MPKLPVPSWLTLSESLVWLAEKGISEDDAKLHIPRAVRDGHIRSRGRGRKFTGHDTKTNLMPSAWDKASVHWETSSFVLPDSAGWAIDLTDVDLSRDDLSKWIGESTSASKAVAPKYSPLKTANRAGRNPKYDWDSFFAEIAVRADLDGLPDTQAELEKNMADWCVANWGEQPSESTIRGKVSLIYNHPRRIKGQ